MATLTSAPTATTNNSGNGNNKEMTADASFLETITGDGTTDTQTPVLELHRSNVLRIETQELLEECRLPLSPSHTAHDIVTWAQQARDYTQTISEIIDAMPESTLTLDDNGATKNSNNSKSKSSFYPFQARSDKGKQGGTPFQFPFPPGSSLRLRPSGSYQHNDDQSLGGLTKPTGNANVLPVLDHVLQLPNSYWNNTTKDYLKERYFDKRNCMVCHIATTLSQKKYKRVVGTVECKWEDSSTQRKLAVLLTPPTAFATTVPATTNESKKKKQKTKNTKKLRFRVQLLFGMESLDWIPPARLFPNRSNLGSTHSSTPYYNFDLSQDGMRMVRRQDGSNDSHTATIMTTDHYDDHLKDGLILLKVWCLQRGLLRGHDSFSTTHLELLLIYLFRTKRITPRMAPLQVFTVWLKFMQDTQWCGGNDNPTTTMTSKQTASHQKQRTALVMPDTMNNYNERQTIQHSAQGELYEKCAREAHAATPQNDVSDEHPPTLVECYLQQFDGPIFLDPSLKHNYFGRISSNFIALLQTDAQASLECLHSSSSTTITVQRPFRFLFLESSRFWNRYDAYITIPLSSIRMSSNSSSGSGGSSATHQKLWNQSEHQQDIGGIESVSRELISVLQRALGDRIRGMRILTTGNGIVQQQHSTTSAGDDSDQIPVFTLGGSDDAKQKQQHSSPLGQNYLELGLQINSDHAAQLVDRGPPANDVKGTAAFLELWGTEKAQLRRFKDGAIVNAVIWNGDDDTVADTNDNDNDDYVGYMPYQGDERTQGGIVERIVRHILKLHFCKDNKKQNGTNQLKKRENSNSVPILQFGLRNMLSLVDGARGPTSSTLSNNSLHRYFSDSNYCHRQIMNAFDSLSDFFRQHSSQTLSIPGTTEGKRSRLGIPLTIDAVEPLSASLRYSELFPPVPHSSLGGGTLSGSLSSSKKVTGVVCSAPILLQIRFGSSSKWPSDLNAMGAAKTAMLIQLADGMERMKKEAGRECDGLDGPIHVTPSYMDIGYKGYSWRIMVRADPELHMLRDLKKPSTEAVALLRTLTRDHVIAAMHHSTIHKVHTEHPSSGSVVRLAKLWASSHMLSDLVPSEAIELMVTKVYNDSDVPLNAPGTVASGFVRFLKLLSTHDWARQPLIVDPQGHISEDDRNQIGIQFESLRGPNQQTGPAMYIISPSDRQGDVEVSEQLQESGSSRGPNKKPVVNHVWVPGFTQQNPEWVTLFRAVALAKRSHQYLMEILSNGGSGDEWSAVFRETPESLKSYSALHRVDPEFVVDSGCSSTGGDITLCKSKESNGVIESSFTRSMRCRYLGPKALRRRVYRNLNTVTDSDGIMYDWTPVQTMVKSLRSRFGSLALFFYNDLAPDVVAMLWRPAAFASHPLSVLHSEHKRPVDEGNWVSDSLTIINAQDIMREMRRFTKDIIVSTRVLDDRSIHRIIPIRSCSKRKSSRKADASSSDGNESE